MTTQTTTLRPITMPTMESRPAMMPTTNHTTSNKLVFDDIPSCITAFRNGEFLIVLDDASRENEGDLIIAAKSLTPPLCAFMIRHTSGYLCAPLTATRAAHFDLTPMVPFSESSDPHRTAYTVTVDANVGVSTGISAADRSRTCNVLAEGGAGARDLRRPGHVVPLIAREGGVRQRRGHTEATWEFCRLAGIAPEVGVIGEMVRDGEYVAGGQPDERGRVKPEMVDSGMMRAPECLEFGRRWGIKCCTIEDLVRYVEETEGRLLQ